MSGDPLDFFERSIRRIEESSAPIPDLRIDSLYRFHEADYGRLCTALNERYPSGHWARDRSNFKYAIEQAIQLLSAGLCNLAEQQFDGGHPLECCVRIVNAPTLSPYIRKDLHNYVIVPTGFLSSLECFVSSTFALAALAAAQIDPDQRTAVWDRDLVLGAIANLAERDLPAFTRGVMEAALESNVQQVLENFSDPVAFIAFDRDVHAQLKKMLPSKTHWQRLGFQNLRAALEHYPAIQSEAVKIARLALCFAVCHEFGHVFTLSVQADGADELAADESFTDMLGTLVLHQLIESRVLSAIIGCAVTPSDLGYALGAFHAWNLGKALGGLLTAEDDEGVQGCLAQLHEVAGRWKKAMTLIREVWIDPVPALAHLEEKPSRGFMITNHWGLTAAGLLRFALLMKGHNMGVDLACRVLPQLADRNSKLYAYIAGTAAPAKPPTGSE